MKILLDPIYTLDPGHCASNAKMRKIVDYLLEKRDDVFFYWLYPEWATEEDLEWYPKSDRIELVPYPQSKDRMVEYLRVDKEYHRMVNFQGRFWDVDIIITNRTSFVPFLKMMAIRPSSDRLIWSKRVFLIEDMPLLDFKKQVAISNPEVTTLQTLTGYLSADDILISAFWEKDYIMRAARAYLSPAKVKYISDTMVESAASQSEDLTFKSKETLAKLLKHEKPFMMAFLGRMTNNMRAEEIFDLMGKHWVFRGGDNRIECIATTQSLASGQVTIPDFVNVMRLPREGFWETMRTKADVFIFMCEEVDYPMSVIESLSMGCPGVILRCRWSVPTLGEDYPFFVDNMAEAYGMVAAIYNDYVGMYKKFIDWVENRFRPLLKERDATYPPLLVDKAIDKYHADCAEFMAGQHSLGTNKVVTELYKYAEGNGGELVLFDAVKKLSEEGVFGSLGDKTSEKFTERVRRVWGTQWNVYRLGLRFLGYEDASPKTGHMRRKK